MSDFYQYDHFECPNCKKKLIAKQYMVLAFKSDEKKLNALTALCDRETLPGTWLR